MSGELHFSIIIPLYNKEKDIVHTLQSLSLQTHTNFEVIVVNDGSTDNSLQLVEHFNDPRIRIFSKENEGVAPTRNFGVGMAKTEHIVFLDADDYWYPFHLEDLCLLVEKFPSGKWYATAYEMKFNDFLTKPLNVPIMDRGETWKGEVVNYFENCFNDSIAWTSAVCFKKSFFSELGGFDTSITMGAGEDTDLWLRAALASPLIFTNRVSATHNLQGSNRISHTPTLKRNFMDLNRYEEAAKKDPDLKKYLDLNRFSIALRHKYAGDDNSFQEYVKELDKNLLSWKQRFLLVLPPFALKLAWFVKRKLEVLGIRVSSF